MSEKKNHIEQYNLIARYLDGNATEQENNDLLDWTEESDDNKKVFLEHIDVWNTSSKKNLLRNLNSDKAFRKFISRINQNRRKSTNKIIKYYLLPVAASILIGISIYFVFQNHSSDEPIIVESNNNSDVKVQLPDNSVVYLNDHSKISFPKKFKRTREVKLTGEAYFEVVSDKLKPFNISAENAIINVLGTSFNVNARPEQENVIVSVKSGKVLLYSIDKKGNKSSCSIIEPDKKGIMNKSSGSIEKLKNANHNDIAWKTNVLTFKETKMSEVLNTLEQHYKVHIKVENKAFYDCELTTIFEDQSFDIVQEILELAFEITIESNNNNYLISGEGCTPDTIQ